jgi:hypothetical protein
MKPINIKDKLQSRLYRTIYSEMNIMASSGFNDNSAHIFNELSTKILYSGNMYEHIYSQIENRVKIDVADVDLCGKIK